MFRIATFTIGTLVLLASLLPFNQASGASPMRPPPSSVTSPVTVGGIRAQFLYETLSNFTALKRLEAIEDCAMGTCGISVDRVICTKMNTPPAGSMEPDGVAMTCSIVPQAGAKSVGVLYDDIRAVSDLRKALMEITGVRYTTADSNYVVVNSIACEVKRLNRELDELELDTAYSCTVTF